ncbi:MAG: hypothetical protein WC942_09520 [Clostridia bacterium]|jgi:phage tail sheath gpL-like
MAKLRLTNGVSFGGKYTVTADDVAVVGVAEVLELTVTKGATKDGDIAISLRGAAPVEVAVTTAASTAGDVAALIQGETYTGWDATVSGAVVTFTASATGAKTGANTVAVAETGVEAAIAVKTPGVTAADGSVTFDFCSSQTDSPVEYDMAASFTVVDDSNVFQPLTDAVITYPAKGQVKLADGSNFKLAEDDIVYIVAQRAVEVE